MDIMTCNTCRAMVQVNATGICLACQMGFTKVPQKDALDNQGTPLIRRRKRKKKEQPK